MKDKIIAEDEIILPLHKWPGYFISNHGRVFTAIKRAKAFGVYVIGDELLEMSPCKTRSGHLNAHLHLSGKSYTVPVHRLVLETFVGPCPEGMECCHEDGDASNNHVLNLRWDTRSNNQKEKVKHHGGIPWTRGERCGTSKLTLSDVREIRRRFKSGEMQKEINKSFPVGKNQISRICRGVNWRHDMEEYTKEQAEASAYGGKVVHMREVVE